MYVVHNGDIQTHVCLFSAENAQHAQRCFFLIMNDHLLRVLLSLSQVQVPFCPSTQLRDAIHDHVKSA